MARRGEQAMRGMPGCSGGGPATRGRAPRATGGDTPRAPCAPERLNLPPFLPFPHISQNLMKLGPNRRADTSPVDQDRKPVRYEWE